MFTYKNFEFGREDQYNFNVYQWQSKQVMLDAGRGKGKGTPTGKFEDKLCFLGHYNTISGVLYKILEMDLEAKEVKDFFKALEEHRKYVDNLFKNVNIGIEVKKVVEQQTQEEV